ncbi:MAG: hypothetical protein ACL7AY_05710 [Candidatus Arsenophonus phytopathogenicus]
MKMPRLTDERRCQSKEEAIAYAMQQIEFIKQGEEPLSPSMKEKRQAMEMYVKEVKELQQFISSLQPTAYNLQPTTYNLQPTTYNLQPTTEIITQKYNPTEDTSDRGYDKGRYMGD